eukprot:TRINITY_DN1038_c0_g2_i1.p1 TRINITY_DN1038_c0_g2~~TRINITY_DN1038_c0_g2_i1.p1  ORF type:complete len:228 (-),score=84.07 TRINITY_DN1038_c0_g2_i1:81-764(-)
MIKQFVKKMSDTPILYSYWRSSCSWRVRIALELKNIDYQYKAVHLVKNGGEQHSDEFKAINPSEMIPALVLPYSENEEKTVITQSVAILEYLEEQTDLGNGLKLLPEDPVERATVRKLVNAVASDIQPVQNLRILQKIGSEGKMEWGKHWITVGFNALESLLKNTSGTYSFGDSITLADVCLIPQIYNANRFGVDMDAYPTINKIEENLKDNECFQRAHPSEQPDAQ